MNEGSISMGWRQWPSRWGQDQLEIHAVIFSLEAALCSRGHSAFGNKTKQNNKKKTLSLSLSMGTHQNETIFLSQAGSWRPPVGAGGQERTNGTHSCGAPLKLDGGEHHWTLTPMPLVAMQ